MRLALEHYSRVWPAVQDVSATEPFDLLCLGGGRQRRVKVKGTAASGDCVLLTRNEVRHARAYRGQVALFLVSHVEIDSSGTARGGRILQFEPWDIDLNRLEAIAYECYRKGSGGQSDEIQERSGWWSLQEHVTASTKTGKVGTPCRRQVSRTDRIRSTQRSPFSL
jgi:Protein NO VEIN, C-terminal